MSGDAVRRHARAGGARGVAILSGALLLGSCTRAIRAPSVVSGPEGVDSVTVALWHMDETGGTAVADAGPFRLNGTAGLDTHTEFGRERNARAFTRSPNSFVYVRANPVLDLTSTLTVEAWVFPSSYGLFAQTPIAARWSPQPGEQSWILTIVGRSPTVVPPGAEALGLLLSEGSRGELAFALQPAEALPARSFFSSRRVQLQRWTHVAATYDGSVVRLYLDGVLDSQYAMQGFVRRSEAPLMVGNWFDPRGLSDFGGDLRLDPGPDATPYHAFEGLIDELRISSAARTRFPPLAP